MCICNTNDVNRIKYNQGDNVAHNLSDLVNQWAIRFMDTKMSAVNWKLVIPPNYLKTDHLCVPGLFLGKV